MAYGNHQPHNATVANSNAFFTFELPFYVIFYEWYVSTQTELIISCVRVIVMAAGYQGFRVLLKYLRLRERASLITGKQLLEAEKYSRTRKHLRRMFNPWHLLQSLILIVQTTNGMWLIQIFMSFNIWMAICVSIGTSLGYFLFAWMLHKPLHDDSQ